METQMDYLLVDEPGDAPYDTIAVCLDYDYLPEKGITHTKTWILRAWAPESPMSTVLDYVALHDALNADEARAWAEAIVRALNDEVAP